MVAQEQWWQEAFDADYLAAYAHRDDDQAAREIAGVLPRLREAGGLVLDACCGNGRHLAALRAAGIPAIGFDWSPPLLAAAAARRGCSGRVFRGDVRRLACCGGFAAITLFFTAFGYFDDEQNRQTLCALGRALRSGGWLLLDLPAIDRLEAEMVPCSRRRLADGRELVEERRMTGEHVIKTLRFLRHGQEERCYQERVRLYPKEEIRALAREAGLQAEACWPGLGGPQDDAGRQVHWLRR